MPSFPPWQWAIRRLLEQQWHWLAIRGSGIPHDAAGTPNLDYALDVPQHAEDGPAGGLRLEGGAVLEVVGDYEVVTFGVFRFQRLHSLLSGE